MRTTRQFTLLIVALFAMASLISAQSSTIGEDGIVRCLNVPIGTTQTIGEDTYEVVDVNLLYIRISENADLSKVCVSNVTNMNSLFFGSTYSQSLENWDVSNVTDMAFMFEESSFNQPLGNWDVSSVTDMYGMFEGTDFNQPIGSWNVG
jgi:surface protein